MEQESDLRRKIYRQGSVRSETREFSAGRKAGILGFILAGKKDRTEKSTGLVECTSGLQMRLFVSKSYAVADGRRGFVSMRHDGIVGSCGKV